MFSPAALVFTETLSMPTTVPTKACTVAPPTVVALTGAISAYAKPLASVIAALTTVKSVEVPVENLTRALTIGAPAADKYCARMR